MCGYSNLDAGYSAVRRPAEILVENPESRIQNPESRIKNREFGEVKL